MGAVAIALTLLLQGPITVAAVSTAQAGFLADADQRTTVCQSGETLPRETSAIRLRVYAFLGPRVAVQVRANGRVIVHGERGSGWTGGVVTVPVNRLSDARSGVQLCFTLFSNGDETVQLAGEPAAGALAARVAAGPLPGRVRVEYLRPSSATWWSLAPRVARRMGLGRAAAGTWVVFLAIGLMCALLAMCGRLILRELA
jgi:hypothetical protein